LCGPAGEVPIIFACGDDGRPRVLCGQGPAPRAATPAFFADLGIDELPGSGVLSAAVPGAFDAWMLLLRDYGTRTLREVLSPAIDYAENGYPMLPHISSPIRRMERILRDFWPTSAALYLRSGASVKPFTVQRNQALAATYRRVLSEAESAGNDRIAQIDAARRAWYQGFVAEAIEEFVRTPQPDADGDVHEGLLTADDLALYQASYEDPVCLDWHGWTLCKPGPWSQGPVMLQQIALLDGPRSHNPGETAEHIHRVVEAAKLAFADRDAFYGDVPDVPLADLLSKDYTAERQCLITSTASRELRPGSPGGRRPRLPRAILESMSAGADSSGTAVERDGGPQAITRRPRLHGDTCHIDAVDRFGNIVAATPSGGYLMGSPVIESLGFPLGNRLEMTWLEEGLPNTLRPGHRPRTTLSPTLALRDGEPTLAFGSPGADLQEQYSLGFFLEVAAGLPLQKAVERPRWHTDHFVSSLYPHEIGLGHLAVEESVGAGTIAELRSRGHDVVVHPRSLGRLSAAGRDPNTGMLCAAADPRSVMYASGR
jgi:gamma-glutamyltranspeptidase/glutathione hydrolase